MKKLLIIPFLNKATSIFLHYLIVIDAIHAFAIDARVVNAIVFVDFAMFATSTGKALTSVAT